MSSSLPSSIIQTSSTLEQPAQSGVVMSAMRPTGRLHLGHYLGVLKNWVKLQQEHTCFFHIADWHALTTKYDQTSQLPEHVLQIAIDWFAAGLEPKKATVYVQSLVPEIAELHLILSMMTPSKWVETDPTLKDMVAMLRRSPGIEADDAASPLESGELTYGLLGYPILQTADILTVRGEWVPVGKDQLAHLEISRDIARRFNHVVGQAIFPEPKPLLTEVPLLIGLDGKKMGKSNNNAIFLADTEDETLAKIKTAITDVKRIKKTDPGEPDDCVAIYPWYSVFTDSATQDIVAEECRAADRGCMACKQQLAERINEALRPIREKRQELEADRHQVEQWLNEGIAKARSVCQNTLIEVKQALHLSYSGLG